MAFCGAALSVVNKARVIKKQNIVVAKTHDGFHGDKTGSEKQPGSHTVDRKPRLPSVKKKPTTPISSQTVSAAANINQTTTSLPSA